MCGSGEMTISTGGSPYSGEPATWGTVQLYLICARRFRSRFADRDDVNGALTPPSGAGTEPKQSTAYAIVIS